MDRYINLADPESRALAAGASVLLVPMKPQPKPHWRPGTPKEWMAATDNRPALGGYPKNCALFHGDNGMIGLRAPFAPGDILHAREALLVLDSDQGDDPEFMGQFTQYRADKECRGWTHDEEGVALYPFKKLTVPARSMPAWAIRHKYPVKSVSAIRVSEIGEEDAAQRCGLRIQMGDGTGKGAGYKWNGPGYHDGFSRNPDGALTFHVARSGEYCSCHEGERLRLTPARCAYRMFWQSRYPKLPWESWAWKVEVER